MVYVDWIIIIIIINQNFISYNGTAPIIRVLAMFEVNMFSSLIA
jgi:hypothetical protein